MEAKELNLLLIKKFPELEKKYHDEVEWQEEDNTGSHIVYGDVFTPFIERITDQRDGEKLQAVFNFIENVLLYEEQYSTEVIMFSVLERLIADKERFQFYKSYFGTYTKNIVEKMQLY